jgi:hypothetical protein
VRLWKRTQKRVSGGTAAPPERASTDGKPGARPQRSFRRLAGPTVAWLPSSVGTQSEREIWASPCDRERDPRFPRTRSPSTRSLHRLFQADGDQIGTLATTPSRRRSSRSAPSPGSLASEQIPCDASPVKPSRSEQVSSNKPVASASARLWGSFHAPPTNPEAINLLYQTRCFRWFRRHV